MRFVAGVIYGAIGIGLLVTGAPGPGLAVLAYTAYLVIGNGRKWIIY